MKLPRLGIMGTMKRYRHFFTLYGPAFALVMLLSGCATKYTQWMTWNGDAITSLELAEVLQKNPLTPNQNIRITLLRQTDQASVHVVQVRTAELPHVHQTHDLTVFVVRGHGTMVLGKETKPVGEGDVIHIPAGVRHYFTNQSPKPAVAVLVFSPGFDGKDTVREE